MRLERGDSCLPRMKLHIFGLRSRPKSGKYSKNYSCNDDFKMQGNTLVYNGKISTVPVSLTVSVVSSALTKCENDSWSNLK